VESLILYCKFRGESNGDRILKTVNICRNYGQIHIAKITATAYQRVNVIFRCFVSRENVILYYAPIHHLRQTPVRVLHSCIFTFTKM